MILESTQVGDALFITLKNKAGLALTLCDFGAGIYEIRYHDVPMTIAPSSKGDYLTSDAYFGKTAGRIAGRIAGAKLHYLGKDYTLDANEGKNTLHGGKTGFSYRHFSSDVIHLGDGVAVDFYLVSPNLDGGFPGEVDLRVRYFLYEETPDIKISYTIKSSQETPLNLTCHTYFNIGGEPTVEHQVLRVASSKTETYSPELIPLGFVNSPACLDFRAAKEVGKDILDPYLQKSRAKGYDHCFLLDSHEKDEPVLRLENKDYALEITTSYPAIQIYSDNYPHPGEALSNGQTNQLHAGLALEPVFRPNDFTAMAVLPLDGKKMSIVYHFVDKGA